MKNSRISSRFFVAIATFLFAAQAHAQTGPQRQENPVKKVMPTCNISGHYIRESNDAAYRRPVGIYTPPGSMSAASIDTCGKFRVFYEDINMGVNGGFNETGLGPVRQNTMCAMLGYVESVIDINVNGTTDFIDIYVERSIDALNPADPTSVFLAQAGPYMGSTFGSSAGVFNGHFYDHAISGVDPEAGQYDAHILVNFDQIYNTTYAFYSPIDYWDDYNVTTATCSFDLYSVLLHEVTHAMGIFSTIERDPGTHDAIAGSGPSFCLFDSLFLYYKDNTNTFHKVMQSLAINTTVNGYTDPLNTNRIWLDSILPPLNQPIYSGSMDSLSYPAAYGSLMSHLNASLFSFTMMSQESPGYQPNYVISPGIAHGQLKRTWTLPELRMLMQMGYGLNPSFQSSSSLNGTETNLSLLTGNTSAYRTNSYTEKMLSWPGPNNFMEVMTADFTIPNNNTPVSPTVTVLPFSVASLANIADPDGDTLRVMQGTLYGIRGVSDGANNHACIQVNAYGDSIKYTPFPGFHGRAQFGFYLWDGHERGGLRIVTIDVTPGSYTLTAGDQMVVYYGMEDGTEVRQRVINPSIEHTVMEHSQYEGVFGGTILSGGSPFNFMSNYWTWGGGDHTYEALTTCYAPLHPPLTYYGEATSDWKLNADALGGYFNPEPAPGPGTNQRYRVFQGPTNYWTLINPVEACNVYRFECDLNFEKSVFTVGQTFQFQLQFVDDPAPNMHTQLYYTAPVQVTITSVAPDTWQHVVFEFQYCGTSTHFMNLLVQGAVTPQIVVTGTGNSSLPGGGGPPLADTIPYYIYSAAYAPFIDNVSLEQVTPTPPPVSLIVSATPDTLCGGDTTTLVALPTPYLPCNATYTWQPGSLSGYSVSTVPPATTGFTVTVDYACSQSVDSVVTVTVIPTDITITPVHQACIWDPPVQLQATPAGGVFTGTGVTSSGGNYYFDPALAGLGGPYVITYTITNSCGVFSDSIPVIVVSQDAGIWPAFVVADTLSARSSGKGIITDAAGNIYIVGSVFTYGTTAALTGGTSFTSNSGSPDIIVAKFTDACGLLWYKIFGGTSDDEGNDIALDADGNVFITGTVTGSYTFESTYNVSVPFGSSAAFVARLDPNDGTVTGFRHTTNFSSTTLATGNAIAVSQTTGEVYVTGSYDKMIQWSPSLGWLMHSGSGGVDVFVVRMNNALTTPSWNTRIFSAGTDIPGALTLDGANNLYIGSTVVGTAFVQGYGPFGGSLPAGQHAFIAKYNSSNMFSGMAIMGDNARLNDIVCDPFGRLFFCGSFTGNIQLAIPHNAIGSDRQMYVARMNAALNFTGGGTWSKMLGSSTTSTEDALGIFLSSFTASVYVTGYGANNSAFPFFTPSSMTGITAMGEHFVARYQVNGVATQLTYTTSAVPGWFNASNAVTVSGTGIQYHTGHITHESTFGSLGTFAPTGGIRALFVARTNSSGAFYRIEETQKPTEEITVENKNDGDVIAYPNPSGGNVELLFSGNIPANVQVTVTDISGRVVSAAHYTPSGGGIVPLNMSMCENGTYIIVINDGNRQISKRVVIQR